MKSSKMADRNLTHFLTEHDLELATWFSSLMVVNDIRGDFSFGVVPSDQMSVRSTISAASWQIFVV